MHQIAVIYKYIYIIIAIKNAYSFFLRTNSILFFYTKLYNTIMNVIFCLRSGRLFKEYQTCEMGVRNLLGFIPFNVLLKFRHTVRLFFYV